MEIIKTCSACPSQWDITLDDGRFLYVRYRWGEFTVRHFPEGPQWYKMDNVPNGELLVCKEAGDGLDGYMEDDEMLDLLIEANIIKEKPARESENG